MINWQRYSNPFPLADRSPTSGTLGRNPLPKGPAAFIAHQAGQRRIRGDSFQEVQRSAGAAWPSGTILIYNGRGQLVAERYEGAWSALPSKV